LNTLVFERFTERARQVVVLAQDEARALKHNYIGTEHLLLGLLREEEGLAARVLESLDITVEEVRAQVARTVGEGDEVATGEVPFTPRAKKVLEVSLREGLSLGHNYIGTEHILLGLVRVGDGVAARVLVDFDADAETIRSEVIRRLSGRPGGEPALRTRSAREAETYAVEGAVSFAADVPSAWEYEIHPVESAATLSAETLNALGVEGWELVAVVGTAGEQRLIFKRVKRPG
jgi:ATP-dependent Clp protease ATP-binding subunit ClpA